MKPTCPRVFLGLGLGLGTDLGVGLVVRVRVGFGVRVRVRFGFKGSVDPKTSGFCFMILSLEQQDPSTKKP